MENVGNNVVQNTDKFATSGRMSYLSSSIKEAGTNFSNIFDSIMASQNILKEQSELKHGSVKAKDQPLNFVKHNQAKENVNKFNDENDEVNDEAKAKVKDVFSLTEDSDKFVNTSELNAHLQDSDEFLVNNNLQENVSEEIMPAVNLNQEDNLISCEVENTSNSAKFTALNTSEDESVMSLEQDFSSDIMEKTFYADTQYEDFDTKAFEDFVKESRSEVVKTTVNVQSENTESQDFANVQLKDLLQKANVTSVRMTEYNDSNPMMENDFGASELSVIEDSLKASIALEENIESHEIVKEKIDAIMDSKEQSNEAALNDSLELLRGNTQNQKTVLESVLANSRNAEYAPAQGFVLQNNQFNLDAEADSENTLSNSTISVKGAQAKAVPSMNASQSQQGSSGGFEENSQNQNLQSGLLGQEKAVNKQQMTKQMNLLNMSSNLRANAEAIAEKVMQMASRNLKRMELDLNPEGLGKLKINFDLGSMENLNKVTFQASSEGAKDLIEKALGTLRDILKSNDIDADVELADYLDEQGSSEQFADNSNAEQESGHGERENKDFESMFTLEDDNSGMERENLSFAEEINVFNSQNNNRFARFA